MIVHWIAVHVEPGMEGLCFGLPVLSHSDDNQCRRQNNHEHAENAHNQNHLHVMGILFLTSGLFGVGRIDFNDRTDKQMEVGELRLRFPRGKNRQGRADSVFGFDFFDPDQNRSSGRAVLQFNRAFDRLCVSFEMRSRFCDFAFIVDFFTGDPSLIRGGIHDGILDHLLEMLLFLFLH